MFVLVFLFTICALISVSIHKPAHMYICRYMYVDDFEMIAWQEIRMHICASCASASNTRIHGPNSIHSPLQIHNLSIPPHILIRPISIPVESRLSKLTVHIRLERIATTDCQHQVLYLTVTSVNGYSRVSFLTLPSASTTSPVTPRPELSPLVTISSLSQPPPAHPVKSKIS